MWKINKEEFLKEREGLLNESSDIQRKKSNDYADDNDIFRAFEISRIAGITPQQAIFSRILDKVSRMANMINGKDMKVKESMRDTVLDLINYVLILQVYGDDKNSK